MFFTRLSWEDNQSRSVKPKIFSYKPSDCQESHVSNMEHVREWKEIVFWDNASEESPPEMEYLEMIRYPHRQEPYIDKGIVDDSSLSAWFSKASGPG